MSKANLKLLDLIQYAQYLNFTISDSNGVKSARWCNEISMDATATDTEDSIIIQSTVDCKVPLEITSSIMLNEIEKKLGTQGVQLALRKAINKWLPEKHYLLTHELTIEDTVMLHISDEKTSLLETEYALLFDVPNSTYEKLVISGGSYGSLEALPMQSYDGWSVQAYRFDRLNLELNSIINDNYMLKQVMTRIDSPIPPPIFRNPNNWKLVILKTFSIVETIIPYATSISRRKT